ncbi:hypothetical protein MBLNU459_g1845t1 [Dothideomycetes sp. NU459]
MQSAQDSTFEMSLRDQLIAAQAVQQPPPPPPAQHVQPQQPLPTAPGPYLHQHSDSSNQHQLDPAIGSQHMPSYGMPGELTSDQQELGADGKKSAKRELSSSKRAAQNRAAQRAFRQRKEAYILKLEKQVKDYKVLEGDFKSLQQDSFQLRGYIDSLHAIMSENQVDYPPAPPPTRLQNPNPVFHPMSMNDPEPAQDVTMQDEQQRFQSQMATDDQRYHQDFHEEERRQQEYNDAMANHNQMQEPTPPSSSSMNHNSSHSHDPLPPAAISQLQAAAAQADELGPSASTSPHQDDARYVPASEYPQRQPRMENNGMGTPSDNTLST